MLKKKLNIGCGQTVTQEYLNYDNSFSLRISKFPLVFKILVSLGLLDWRQRDFIQFATNKDIMYADARRRIPLPDNSVEVLYTSHMIEHLDRVEIKAFFKEAKRVLISGGIIRIAFPDLKIRITQYNDKGDADAFMESTCLARNNLKELRERLRFLLIVNWPF